MAILSSSFTRRWLWWSLKIHSAAVDPFAMLSCNPPRCVAGGRGELTWVRDGVGARGVRALHVPWAPVPWIRSVWA